jgi:predicted adenine nucleotide alpha hydrolase (AANH) superfamily ATPase
MNRRQYQRELDRIIEKQGERRPRVLLHVCCGPCSSAVLEYLTKHFELTLLWYNPNIYPESEFEKRRETLQKLVRDMGLSDRVNILLEPWRSEDYAARVVGLENEPEGGRRCTECFRLRLEETAKLAAERGFDYFCTTLTLSRHKDAVRINTLAEEIAAKTGARWLPSDFKKHDGENRSIELCEQYNVYRQLYCGCEYSLRRREEQA